MTALMNSQIFVFKPKGHITAASVDNFHQQFSEAIYLANHPIFLVDMSGVEFLDSAGLMAIVSSFRIVQEQGIRFAICTINDPVRIIFELVRLDEFIEIYKDHREFEKSLLIAA